MHIGCKLQLGRKIELKWEADLKMAFGALLILKLFAVSTRHACADLTQNLNSWSKFNEDMINATPKIWTTNCEGQMEDNSK